MPSRESDYFGIEPITLWRCGRCGYVDVVRPENGMACGGCGEEVSGTTHTYRPDPIGVRRGPERLEVVVTKFGFDFGAAEVVRASSLPDGSVCVIVSTPFRKLDIYCSPTGRSIRVYSRGEEWKPPQLPNPQEDAA